VVKTVGVQAKSALAQTRRSDLDCFRHPISGQFPSRLACLKRATNGSEAIFIVAVSVVALTDRPAKAELNGKAAEQRGR
jgi:hypothetical protein